MAGVEAQPDCAVTWALPHPPHAHCGIGVQRDQLVAVRAPCQCHDARLLGTPPLEGLVVTQDLGQQQGHGGLDDLHDRHLEGNPLTGIAHAVPPDTLVYGGAPSACPTPGTCSALAMHKCVPVSTHREPGVGGVIAQVEDDCGA